MTMLGRIETAVLRQGERGPRVLFSHCSLAHSGGWKPLLAELGEVRAEALDLPGHGGTQADPNRSPQRQAADAVLDLLGDGPAHLVGHSFGGRVMLRSALDRPEAVASLTLIEPMMFHLLETASDPLYAVEVAASQTYAGALEGGDNAEAARLFTALWGNGAKWEDTPERQRRYAERLMPFITASAEDVMRHPPHQITLDDIAGLPMPVTLIAGAATRPSAIAICRLIGERIGVEPYLVDGAGHMVPITHAAEVAEILKGFLAA
ncbi:alpha/beta fold hydrolase [Pontivivens ytuae]|uniref:Alpha/beta hydrolase n=1 Tax=Pontivivens ytuae TaxID=2789856 RepID=A0A7S9QDY9_9RHOB|nr:alpha/beta hydrolase [Pontivivens ytuae]QPH55803.1 alpha/beta hydrolase [Pontivivens ytuae]